MSLVDNTKKLGTLFLVPTWLGAAEECAHTIPVAHAEQLHHVRYFLVEGEKHARQFIKTLHLSTPLQSCVLTVLEKPDHHIKQSIDYLAPLKAGHDVALLSEAGCPAIADPGADIVQAAHILGARVVPLVGPSSIVLALMASGLNGQCFAFHGYVPIQTDMRKNTIMRLSLESERLKQTQIIIETPYRNQNLLTALCDIIPAKARLCVATELTTQREWIKTCRIDEWRTCTLPLPKVPAIFLWLV